MLFFIICKFVLIIFSINNAKIFFKKKKIKKLSFNKKKKFFLIISTINKFKILKGNPISHQNKFLIFFSILFFPLFKQAK